MAYEPIAKERFTIEHGAGGEQIRIPAPRLIFVMLFLPVWLAAWTAGGAAAVFTLLKTFQLFLLVWLCFWAAGWLFAASAIAWMFFGFETLRIVGGELEITKRLFGWSTRKLYRGGEISQLKAAAQSPWPYRFYWQTPFFWRGQGDRFSSTMAPAPSMPPPVSTRRRDGGSPSVWRRGFRPPRADAATAPPRHSIRLSLERSATVRPWSSSDTASL